MNSNSQETLRRVTQDDPSLTILIISNNYGGADGKFYSDNSDDYSTLGAAIANNTHLAALRVWLSDDLPLGVANRGFYDGLKSNSSISDVQLSCNHITIAGGVGQEILKAYQEKNSQLTALRIIEANLQNGGDRVIVDGLRNCRNLQRFDLFHCNITDEQLLPIADALRGHHLLEALGLGNNNIGNAGCVAIAALLADRNCKLRTLQFWDNAIHNEGATTIANSLANNKQLQNLYLYGNPTNQTQFVFSNIYSVQEVFSNILCNASNINSLYASNHTLKTLHLEQQLGQQLGSLLSMNEGENKSHVAIKKILQNHPNIDMEPFFDWGMEEEGERNLKALPYVVEWFEKARVAVAEGEENYHFEENKLSAIFQFAKAMPLLLEGIARYDTNESGGSGNKRKRTEG